MNQHRLDLGASIERRFEHLLHQLPSLLLRCKDDAFLNHVRSEFLLRENEKLAGDFADDEVSVDRISFLDDPLNDVLRHGDISD